MGYRSDVALVLSQEASVKLIEYYKKASDDTKDNLKSILNDAKYHNIYQFHNNELGIIQMFLWKEIKWYSGSFGYKDVDALENFMHALDEEYEEHYLFIRIGENSDDIEERGSYYDNPFDLCVERKISYDSSNSIRERGWEIHE